MLTLDQLRKNLSNKTPSERLIYWIKERETIRVSKEVKKTPQTYWTSDPILATYRFCNVRRMDDRVSKWLLTNWYEPYKNHRNIVYACALARFINKPESLSQITKLVFRERDSLLPAWESIKKELRSLKANGTVFNGAYTVRSNDGVDKIESVVDFYVKPLSINLNIDTTSMSKTWGFFTNCYGFGSFMAGQVVADLRWAMDGLWEDRKTWAPVGPWSARGLARICATTSTPFSYLNRQYTSYPAKWLEDFRKHILKSIPTQLPLSLSKKLEAHDYQNCLCEFDKYERTLHGEGKPKQFYKPYSGSLK